MSRNYLIHPEVMPEHCLHINGGSPYGGKSTITAQLLDSLVNGKPFFVPHWSFERLAPQDVGIVFCDRPAQDNDRWLRKLGLLEQGIRCFDAVDYPDAKLLGPQMAEHVLSSELKGVRLLVWETADEVMGGDIFRDTLVIPAMRQLQALCLERRLTMLLNLYGVKTRASKEDRYADPIEQLRGCAPVRGKTSTILFVCSEGLTSKDGCGFQRFIAAPRDAKRTDILIERGEDGFFRYDAAASYHAAWKTAQGPANDLYGDVTVEQLEFLAATPPHPALAVYAAFDTLPGGATRAQVYGLFQDTPKRTTQERVKKLVDLGLLVDRGERLFRHDRASGE